MYKGTRYRVTCDELQASRTKEDSIAKANAWWDRKFREIAGNTTDLAEQLAQPKPMIVAPNLLTLPSGPMSPEEAANLLTPKPANPDRSVKACGQAFLEIVRGNVRPMSYRELKWYIEQLPDQDADVSIYDEARIEKMYLSLRNGPLSASRRKKLWGFLKRFLHYLWSLRLIELPRNLNSHTFTVHPQKIKTYTIVQVRKTLDRLQPRQRLYGLLVLNCGCNNVDIGSLRKDQVDLEAGTLTRRRVKTGDKPNVPTVTYKLWPRTLSLLKKCWSDHAELVLTSRDNTPLWTASVEGDRTPRKDLVLKQWRKTKSAISLRELRSVAATLLEDHPVYGRYTHYYLGHAPRSVADKHYVVPSQERFDDAMTWLHAQIFGEPNGESK
jgi:integrase